VGLARVHRPQESLGIHGRNHEHLAAVGIGGNDRDQSIAVELRRQELALLDLFDGGAPREAGGLWQDGQVIRLQQKRLCYNIALSKVHCDGTGQLGGAGKSRETLGGGRSGATDLR
jgi:hypothetical protein